MTEAEFLAALRTLPLHPGARDLRDDCAVIEFGGETLVLNHDVMVEGVHFLADADPADVAWKLVAVNLSDLAAKGAKPLGVLLGYGRTSGDQWDAAFVEGLKQAIDRFAVPLLGGDTVAMGANAPRTFGLTAIGEAKGHIVPSRSNAKPGHAVYVTGTIGDAWAGLQIASGSLRSSDIDTTASLLKAHTRPTPRLEEGRILSNLVSSMMDISDGLLLDASRIAAASGVQIEIDLAEVPLSKQFQALVGDDTEARIKAATGGDDYQLLLTASPETVLSVPLTCVGICRPGSGVALHSHGERLQLPEHLGFVHA